MKYFVFSMNRVSVNVDKIKVFVIQSKNGIIINVDVTVKELDDWSSCQDDYMWNPSTCDCQCIVKLHVKLTNI